MNNAGLNCFSFPNFEINNSSAINFAKILQLIYNWVKFLFLLLFSYTSTPNLFDISIKHCLLIISLLERVFIANPIVVGQPFFFLSLVNPSPYINPINLLKEKSTFKYLLILLVVFCLT